MIGARDGTRTHAELNPPVPQTGAACHFATRALTGMMTFEFSRHEHEALLNGTPMWRGLEDFEPTRVFVESDYGCTLHRTSRVKSHQEFVVKIVIQVEPQQLIRLFLCAR